MAAWSRPASPTARGTAITQLIYLDAFVPDDGQSLLDLNEPARPRMQELAKTGDGWRVPPNPTPPDTPPADVEWLTARRVDMPIKCFLMTLKLHGGKLTLPRSYIYATRITPADTFGPFAEARQGRAGLALLRDRRQPFAARHRAGSADGAAREDRRGKRAIRRRHSGTRVFAWTRNLRFSDAQLRIVVRASHAPE